MEIYQKTLICDRCVQSPVTKGEFTFLEPTGKMPDGSVCPICHGTGKNVLTESANDAIRDWEDRNFWTLVFGFALTIVGFFTLGWRWAFGPRNPSG